MTEKRKKLLKWLGYPALAWVTFIFALHFTFPYDRLRERIVEELSKEMDVNIAEIGPGWLPGRVKVTGLSLTTRPKREDEKPRTFTLDQVNLAIGILPLITRTVSIDIDASLGSGEITGTVSRSASGVNIEMRARDISLETVPGIGVVTGGAPIKGPVEAHLKLNLPKGKWASASGVLELSCAGCSVGDGVTKWRPTSASQTDAFTSSGFTLPRLDVGEFNARVPIARGIGCLSKFDTRGGNILVTVEGGVRFADPFTSTQAELQARVKTSDEFKKDPNAAIFSGIKDAEGWLTYQARSPLTALRWVPARTVLAPLRECDGVAPPPTAPKTSVAARTTAPSIPVPAPRPAADAEAPPTSPEGTPIPTMMPPPPEPTPAAAPPPPAPTPEPPPPPQPQPQPQPTEAPPPPQPDVTAPPPPAPAAGEQPVQ